MARTFDLGLKAADLSAPPVVGFDRAFETLRAELAGVAVRRLGRVLPIAKTVGAGVETCQGYSVVDRPDTSNQHTHLPPADLLKLDEYARYFL